MATRRVADHLLTGRQTRAQRMRGEVPGLLQQHAFRWEMSRDRLERPEGSPSGYFRRGAQRARRGLRRRQDPCEFRIDGASREFRIGVRGITCPL